MKKDKNKGKKSLAAVGVVVAAGLTPGIMAALPIQGSNAAITAADMVTIDGKSYDVLGDGSLVMVNIPGHSEGLCALKIKNDEGKYVLLFADGGYATKSWREMITSGITLDKKLQRQSLQWIREQSLSPDCVASLATHDTDVEPYVIEL